MIITIIVNTEVYDPGIAKIEQQLAGDGVTVGKGVRVGVLVGVGVGLTTMLTFGTTTPA